MDADITQVPTANPDDFGQERVSNKRPDDQIDFTYEDVNSLVVIGAKEPAATWDLRLTGIKQVGVSLAGPQSRINIEKAKQVDMIVEGSDPSVAVKDAQNVTLTSTDKGGSVNLDAVENAIVDGRDLTINATNGRVLGHNCRRGRASNYDEIIQNHAQTERKWTPSALLMGLLKRDSTETSGLDGPSPETASRNSKTREDPLTRLIAKVETMGQSIWKSKPREAPTDEESHADDGCGESRDPRRTEASERSGNEPESRQGRAQPMSDSGSTRAGDVARIEGSRLVYLSYNLSISSKAPYESAQRDSE